MAGIVQKLATFLRYEIWRIRRNTTNPRRFFLIRFLRVVILSVRGFDEDKCQLRASALTFYTLLSIVPVFAMAFGIAKGFGFEKRLEALVIENLKAQEEVLMRVVEFARALLANTQGGLVAGIGIAVLFWSVIKVLGNVENSFNDIWGVKRPRTMLRRFTDYLSIMMICPVLFILSSSATVFVTSRITMIVNKVALLGAVGPLIFFCLRFTPYVVIWVLFTFVYMFMPNTRVRFDSALLGGVVAGTIYQITQWAYIAFQLGVAKYNAIYGSFAALPLFLIWVQLSWLVVLFGAEIVFAHQNVDTYEFEPDCFKASSRFKKLLALGIVHACIQQVRKAEDPLSAGDISQRLGAPIRLVNEMLFELIDAKILIEARKELGETGYYVPVKDIGDLTIFAVTDALERRGTQDIPLSESGAFSSIRKNIESFEKKIQFMPENTLLKDIT